ncbi:hypothetical protein OIN60_04425 [Paenibacillus sp. P96]|uniref:Uncharacterized protein n=1 Tax=Paenibacillus zeirhizosphaerae TaxID=2987519 RepID=A0ABT9FMS7_9BACL|nr:hypothetical protein [Paenibacillus sp. P96]MDP4096032.1 hypothetical protein [Paenibacillus sp. P96]
MAQEKKQLTLSPEAFTVNSQGEVVISDSALSEALLGSAEENKIGEQGIQEAVKVSVSVSF